MKYNQSKKQSLPHNQSHKSWSNWGCVWDCWWFYWWADKNVRSELLQSTSQVSAIPQASCIRALIPALNNVSAADWSWFSLSSAHQKIKRLPCTADPAYWQIYCCMNVSVCYSDCGVTSTSTVLTWSPELNEEVHDPSLGVVKRLSRNSLILSCRAQNKLTITETTESPNISYQ